MQTRLLLPLSAAFSLLLAAGCERSLLHSLPEPLPATDQGTACAHNAPSDLVAVAHEDRVELSWTDNAQGKSPYVVERRTVGAFEDLTAPMTSSAHSDSFTARDTLYVYRVRAEGPGCAGVTSETVEVLTFPRPPSGLTASGGEEGVALFWEDENRHESGYRVELVDDAGEVVGEPLATLPENSTSWTDEGLAPDTVRRYRVVAVNPSGEAGEMVEGGSRPHAPSELVATVLSPTRVALSWTDTNHSEDGYRVYRVREDADELDPRDLDAGPGSEPDHGQEVLLAVLPAGSTSYEDESALDSMPYIYSVTATNASGESERATTTVTTPCPGGNLSVPLDVHQELSADWDAPFVWISWEIEALLPDTNSFEFRLERALGDDPDFIEVALPSNWPAFDDQSAEPDTRYRYRIVGEKRTCQVVSEEVEVVTVIPPIAPDDIDITPLSDTELEIEWADTFTNEIGFGVYLAPSWGYNFSRQPCSPAANETSCTVDGLEPGEWYKAVVIPEVPDSSELSLPNDLIPAISKEGRTLPSSPILGDNTLEVRTGNSIELSGWLPAGADGVHIFRGGAVIATREGGDYFTYVDEGLEPGTTYEYDIFGYNTAGLSAPLRLVETTFHKPILEWTGPPTLTAYGSQQCEVRSKGEVQRDRPQQNFEVSLVDHHLLSDHPSLPTLSSDIDGVTITIPMADDFFFRHPISVRWIVEDQGGRSSLDRTIAIDVHPPSSPTPASGPYPLSPGQQPAEELPTVECNPTGCFGRPASITAGARHSCVVERDGGLSCFGMGTTGALGNGGITNATHPVRVCQGTDCTTSLRGVSAVSAGADFTCALVNFDLMCWGETDAPLTQSNTTPPIDGIGYSVSTLSAGDDFVCFVTHAIDQRELYCFGKNDSLQLGSEVGAESEEPVRVCPPDEACEDASYAAVSAGRGFACGVTSGSFVHCWGSGEHGQLGGGASPLTSPPVAVACGELHSESAHCEDGALGQVNQVAAGGEHACALLRDGRVACWGRAGALGRTVGGDHDPSPGLVCNDASCLEPLQDVVAIAAGAMTCAIRDDHTLWCWGGPLDPYPQQLCEGGFGASCSGADLPVLAVAVEVGNEHLCLVELSGQVRCVGDGEYGRLGDGSDAPGSFRVSAVCESGTEESCVPYESAMVRACGELKAFEVTP